MRLRPSGSGTHLAKSDQRPQPDVRRQGAGLDHDQNSAAGQSSLLEEGIEHPSAKLFPVERTGRHLGVFDPKTKKFTLIDTCFNTHHLVFAEDANNTLWLSSGGRQRTLGWLNTKMFDETGDEQKSQG